MNVVSLFEDKIQTISKELENNYHLGFYNIDDINTFFINFSPNTYLGENLTVIFHF